MLKIPASTYIKFLISLVFLGIFLVLAGAYYQIKTNPEIRYALGLYDKGTTVSNKTRIRSMNQPLSVKSNNSVPVINSFSASKYSISKGQSTTLSWNISKATNASIDQGVGSINKRSGSRTVTPSQSTTYTLMALNNGGMVTAQVIVEVLNLPPPVPTATFTANPTSITYGQASTLTWTTTDASTVTIDQGLGTVYPSSSTTVMPTSTITYTLTATNVTGTVTKAVTISVNLPPAPTASFSATPTSIVSGSSSILTWSTTDATTISINQGIGSVGVSGSRTVTPTATTVYTLTVSNVTASISKQVTVTVTPPTVVPSITDFSVNPTSITTGQSATLAWTITNATSASINQNIGAVSTTTGTKSITPSTTTTYTLTAANTGGTVTKQVTVSVASPTASEILVTTYGANGSDSIDDTTAFNNAMMAAGTSTTLKVPAGTYKVSTLNLKSGLTMKGEGNSSFINGKVVINTGNKISYLKLGISGSSVSFAATVSGTYLDHITFIGGVMNDEYGPVLDISKAMTDTHFYDCVVETNVNGKGNGVSIIDNGVPQSNTTNVEFVRLHVMSQPRMDFEMIGREFYGPRTLPYHHITIKDSIFEVSGAETVSFDTNGVATDVLVENNIFKGSGTSTVYPWHQTLEFNKTTNSIVRGNTFYRADGWWLNFNSANMLVENNTFDSSVNNINITPSGSGKEAMGGTCNTCTFQNNKFTMTTGGAWSWWEKFINSKIINNTFTDTRNSAATFYFTNGSTGSSVTGNTFIGNYKPTFSISSDSSIAVANNIYQTPSGALVAGNAEKPKGLWNGVKWSLERTWTYTIGFWENLIKGLFSW